MTRRAPIMAVITIITLVASVITIYEFAIPQSQTQTTLITTSVSVVQISQNFDFGLSVAELTPSGAWFTMSSYTKGLCQASGTTVRISVFVTSGIPQPVKLYVESVPPIVASISFSVNYATPPFDSYLTIVPNWPPPSSRTTTVNYLTIVAESGQSMRTLTLTLMTGENCYI